MCWRLFIWFISLLIFLSFFFFFFFHWYYALGWDLTSSWSFLLSDVAWQECFLRVEVVSPTPIFQPGWPVSLWVITFDLSGIGDPTSGYATVSIALRIIWPFQPHHYVKYLGGVISSAAMIKTPFTCAMTVWVTHAHLLIWCIEIWRCVDVFREVGEERKLEYVFIFSWKDREDSIHSIC